MTTTVERTSCKTLADVLARLGCVPPERVAACPSPGSATENDLLLPRDEKRLYELVDGVLVEKAMGYYESLVAGVLIQLLRNFLDTRPLGIVIGADGMLRLAPGLVRAPDVSFIAWERFPGGQLVPEPIPNLAPDLAVEILSASNTVPEMQRKLGEYLAAGCRLVWYVEPRLRTVHVYSSPAEFHVVGPDGMLEGGSVLPGFTISVADWFERAERHMPPDSPLKEG